MVGRDLPLPLPLLCPCTLGPHPGPWAQALFVAGSKPWFVKPQGWAPGLTSALTQTFRVLSSLVCKMGVESPDCSLLPGEW